MRAELEIFIDKGPSYGDDGGPAFGGSERFVEIWNLVFMQYNRGADGTTEPLPRPSIDTGAGLERILPVIQGVDSLYDTDLFVPMLETAQSITGRTYGSPTSDDDVGLRIMADHGRAMAMLVADGVLPSNEGRGYVLRRIIRRAVRRARQLGVTAPCTERLVDTAVAMLGAAHPGLAEQHHLLVDVVTREEEGFLRTLATGSAILEEELASGRTTVPGDVAFRLHDTYGFPVELTVEIAEEAGAKVDLEGFEAAMDRQRTQARAAARAGRATAGDEAYRSVLDTEGRTTFVGQSPDGYSAPARVVAVLADNDPGPGRPGRALPRPHPVLRGERRPDGRHRDHRDRDGHRPGLRHGVGPARTHLAPGHGRPGRSSSARMPWPPSTGPGATRCAATTPAPICSMPPSARCWATRSASRVRWWPPTASGSTSATTAPSPPRSWPRSPPWPTPTC